MWTVPDGRGNEFLIKLKEKGKVVREGRFFSVFFQQGLVLFLFFLGSFSPRFELRFFFSCCVVLFACYVRHKNAVASFVFLHHKTQKKESRYDSTIL